MTETHIAVSLSFVGELRSLVGIARDEMALPDDSTVNDLIAKLEHRYPPLSAELDGGLGINRGRLVLFVNGLNIAHGDGRSTRVKDGDSVVLTKPLGGG